MSFSATGVQRRQIRVARGAGMGMMHEKNMLYSIDTGSNIGTDTPMGRNII